MDILQNIDTNVSSMVTSSFDEFISTKVKEAVEKEKEKFLKDLNMCEEEYPVFEPSNGLTEEDIELVKSCLELGWASKMVTKEHPDYQYVLSQAKKKRGDGETFDENNFKEEYEKMYGKILSYYKTLTEYPHKIIDDNQFLIPFHGSKTIGRGGQISDSYGYGITNKGTVYQNIRKASPYYMVGRCGGEGKTSSKYFEMKLHKERLQNHDITRQFRCNMYPDTRDAEYNLNTQEVILLPNDKFKEERSRNTDTVYSKFHLYDISKYIKQSGSTNKCRSTNKCSPARDYGTSNNSNCIDGRYYEGTGCKCGQVLVKNVKKVEYEEEDPRNEKIVDEETYKRLIRKMRKHSGGGGCLFGNLEVRERYPAIKKIKEEIEYKIEGGPKEDSMRRYLEDDICPVCGAGELLYSIEDIGFDPNVINKYPLNKEYIDILHLIKPDNIEMVFGIQTIYAKYHPRANENFVIEGKLKKLNDIEEVINGRVSQKVAEEKACLKNEKEIYSEKIKQLNEEKLKRIFSMFILRNEKKRNIDEKKNNDNDKNTIREMINYTKERCNQKETNWNVKMEKEREEFEKEKEEYRKKVSGLIDIANDINELNEEQDDKSCKSTDIFNIIKKLTDYP